MAVDKDLSILVVADQKFMRQVHRTRLGELGFTNVTEADDGDVGLQKMRIKHFDLVLSDWNMVAMSGIELLRNVRSEEALKGVPFILMTTENSVDKIMLAKKAGVSNYIVKPYTADTLKSKLKTVLGPF
jgi:two-component system chemotaxis response regulator CheY